MVSYPPLNYSQGRNYLRILSSLNSLTSRQVSIHGYDYVQMCSYLLKYIIFCHNRTPSEKTWNYLLSLYLLCPHKQMILAILWKVYTHIRLEAVIHVHVNAVIEVYDLQLNVPHLFHLDDVLIRVLGGKAHSDRISENLIKRIFIVMLLRLKEIYNLWWIIPDWLMFLNLKR